MKKLIPLHDFILVTVSDSEEPILKKYESIVDYTQFINQEITFEMFDGDNKMFDGLVYHDIQPSTEWNYWRINGRKIFQESNMGSRVRLVRKLSELTDLGLTIISDNLMDPEPEKPKTEQTHESILPCPFCGARPIWVHLVHPSGVPGLSCPTCQIIMKRDRHDKSIANWNHRVETYLYDKVNKRPVRTSFKDSDGNFYIDTDPNGVQMSGKITIVSVANNPNYEGRQVHQ